MKKANISIEIDCEPKDAFTESDNFDDWLNYSILNNVGIAHPYKKTLKQYAKKKYFFGFVWRWLSKKDIQRAFLEAILEGK